MPQYYAEALDEYGVAVIHTTLGNMQELGDIKFCHLYDVRHVRHYVCECPQKLRDLVKGEQEKHIKIWRATRNNILVPAMQEIAGEKKKLHKKVIFARRILPSRENAFLKDSDPQ